jgi:asparagine synthase (glutamine-hydrolysing)
MCGVAGFFGSVGGRQPMATPGGDICASFNDGIFNHVELRRDLIARGQIFRTTSDTEVILHLCQEVGPDCVTEFNSDSIPFVASKTEALRPAA